jgi:hypothetical protein
MSSPYPLLRPYWKGHSREEDEKLAKELFYGTTATNKETGRHYHHYPLADGPHERRALEALRRLLLFDCYKVLEPRIFAALCCSLDPNSDFERRLIFKGRKKGRRHDFAADSQIDVHVLGLRRMGWPSDAAVKDAEKKFGLSRKAVYEARKRVNSWLKV